jgi:hypothetical protein
LVPTLLNQTRTVSPYHPQPLLTTITKTIFILSTSRFILPLIYTLFLNLIYQQIPPRLRKEWVLESGTSNPQGDPVPIIILTVTLLHFLSQVIAICIYTEQGASFTEALLQSGVVLLTMDISTLLCLEILVLILVRMNSQPMVEERLDEGEMPPRVVEA